MLLTLGKDAKARLSAIGSPARPAPEANKALAEAQAGAAARDLFYYIDFDAGAGRASATLGEEPRLAALAQGRQQPDSDDLHRGRRRRRQAVDDGHHRAGGGVHLGSGC